METGATEASGPGDACNEGVAEMSASHSLRVNVLPPAWTQHYRKRFYSTPGEP
jgi:hypothetical protein